MVSKLFRFFIFSSFFISLCSVLMIYQTYQLLLQEIPDYTFFSFVFFSTVCSYNFHWYLTPHSVKPSQRIQWAQKHKGYHLALFFIGLAGSAIFFFQLIQYWHWLLLGALITFLYSAPKLPHELFHGLKKIAVGKTIFLSLVWTYVTTILPLLICAEPFMLDMLLFIISRFFLIYAICILFDYRDREDDKAEGIRSMITNFSEKGITLLFIFSIALFFIATILMYFFGHSWTIIIILLMPGIIVAALYDYAKRNFSDLFYYFILDGLMMLSALLMLLLAY
jgi:1,4-dihydroxy-2-naphthoate octaprenyltransferase